MKRTLAMVLCFVMLLSLSATCGYAQENAVSGSLEIQYFVGGYGSAWWEWIVDAFKTAYPDVEVIVNCGSDINETMNTRWISNTPPDLVYLDGPSVSETKYVQDGMLMDITDWIGTIEIADGKKLADNFLVNPSNYDGRIYAVPMIYDNRCVWYDAAEFSAKGWNVPTNYSQWYDVMAQIKQETGLAPLGATGVYPSVFMKGVLYPAFADEGGKDFLMSLIDGKEGAWSSAAALNVMTKLQAFVEAGFIDPNFAGETHTESQMSFLNHGNYFVATGFWLPNEMKGSIPENFEFGMVATPMNDEGKPSCTIPDIKTVGIAKNAKNPEAAKAFIQFMFTEESAIKMAELAGTSLNLNGIDYATSENVPSYLIAASAMLADVEKTEIVCIDHAMSTDLQTPICDLLNLFMMGEIDASAFCEQAEAAAELYRLVA